MIVVSGVKCSCAYDMLRNSLRDVYYRLMEAGQRPTHMHAGRDTLTGYEMLTQLTDPPVTMFKDLVVTFDASVPKGEMRFMQGGEVVGLVKDIS